MFSALKTSLIPQPHGYMDDERRYNVGLTWIDPDGLTDVHNIEIKYVRNCETTRNRAWSTATRRLLDVPRIK